MACAHGWLTEAGDQAFSIDASNVVFGRGALGEVGDHVRAACVQNAHESIRVALFTDRFVGKLVHVTTARASLEAAGCDVVVYDEVAIEPTDASFLAAARFAREGRFDAYVSVGGGSVIDTCKAAMLYATYPAEFLTYVNKPVGARRARAGAAPAACRVSHDLRNRQRDDRHRRLRCPRARGEDGDRVAPPPTVARARRPRVHGDATGERRGGERLRRPLSRARVVHGPSSSRASAA